MLDTRQAPSYPIPLIQMKKKFRLLSVLALSCILSACQEQSSPINKINLALEEYIKGSISTSQDEERGFALDEASVSSESSGGFSQTNTQEANVDEADLIKFDGRYLYITQQPTQTYYLNYLDVMPLATSQPMPAYYDTNKEEAKKPGLIRVMAPNNTPSAPEIAQIPLTPDTLYVHGLYTYTLSDSEHGLAVISQQESDISNSQQDYDRPLQTKIKLINVENPNQIKGLWQLKFEGNLISSRRIDNRLYLVTQFQSDMERVKPEEALDIQVDNFLPQLMTGEGSQSLFKPSDCVVPENTEPDYTPTLVSIITIDLDHPEAWQATCLAGSISNIYSSPTANYLISNTNYYYGAKSNRTRIHKFALNRPKAEYRGTGSVPGFLNTPVSFSLGEHNNILRVISTETDWQASIDTRFKHYATTLSESDDGSLSLNEIAQIPNSQSDKKIGKPGEQIYSTRFFGDHAYVVTYQQVDPLYVINFSDPGKPFIEGEVELPGFSEYLHPLGENYVLGIGKDATETDQNLALYQGLKLALFNVSNPAKPVVEQEIIIGERGTNSSALYDHHAISFLKENNTQSRFTLPISLFAKKQTEETRPSDNYASWIHNGLYLFELDFNNDEPISHTGTLISKITPENNYYQKALNQVQRSLIIDDFIHFSDHGQVWSAAWITPEKTIGPQ